MNFFTADVEIKVDTSKLPAQLAKVKSATLRTVDKIKAAFGRMATSFKAAWDKMVRVAKYAAVGIAAALTLATRAAMKQEDAQFLLMAALKISGEYTKALEDRFKSFAASIQQVTIYGDEEVLALMQLQKSLGVTANKLELAAKQAIGLATATGRDVKSMAMYIALAQQGEFTMLRRYIPALRATTDKAEQLAIITRVCAEGFALAEERAKTASGGLRQMWNALGDVAEIIGWALLPSIKDSSAAIKEWAKRNQERIGEWAKEVVRYVGLAKDVFVEWVRYLRTDWRAAVDDALKAGLILLKGFWQASVVLMQAAGRASGQAFVSAFGEPITKFADEWEKAGFWERLDRPVSSALYAIFGGIAESIRDYNKKVGAETIKETEATWDKIKRIAKTTATEIKAIMGVPKEPDFMTTFPEVIRFEAEPWSWEKETVAIGDAEQAVDSIGDTFVSVGGQIKEQITSWRRGIEEFGWALEDSIGRGLENTMRDFDNWKDHLLRIFEEIYWAAVRIAFVDPTARILAGAFTTMLSGQVGQADVPVMVGGEMGSLSAASRPPGLQGGGFVEKTGWAKVHKGETYSGVGGAGAIAVHIHNEGNENLEIESAEEFEAFDQRILDVTMRAAKTNTGYRRSHKKIRGR